jgi:hypothetical protein
MKNLAIKHNESGTKLLDQKRYQAAEKQFLKATKLAPTWSVPWYNLGLIYKKQRRWSASLTCNQRATQLDARDQAAWWNMGIAATALGKWAEARQAWQGYGIQLPAGEGPLKMNIGPTPIRLNPAAKGEVVWCTRIDPARAVIKNIPLPDSGHCFADIVLHDGEPNGYRLLKGREVPVFDALEILEPSAHRTYEVTVLFRSLEDIEVLIELADQDKVAVEDWGTIRRLCQWCSEGKPHERHETETPPTDQPVQLGVAAQTEEEVRDLCEQWGRERLGCKLSSIECVFSH